MEDLIITAFSNPTKKGVMLHLNRQGRLKTGTGYFQEVWVSWDKIGRALFDDYADHIMINDIRQKLTDGKEN